MTSEVIARLPGPAEDPAVANRRRTFAMPTTTIRQTPFLRTALLGDAAASGATGLLLVIAAGPLAPMLGLPEPLLRVAGLLLLPYAAFVGWAGTRAAPSRATVRGIVLVNLLWVADSALLLILGPALTELAPTALGIAFVLAQALAVLGFAVAQWIALRRAGSSGGAPALA
jgi:hypothetical protein